MTSEGHAALTAELKLLISVERPKISKEIGVAREHGDLRENAEYKSAKERQSYLQARLAQLHQRAAALEMVNLDKIPTGKVGLGSTVTLRHLGNSAEVIYEIVMPEESDPPNGRISAMSPIGRCLLNHEEGDELEVRVPAGVTPYEVVKLVTIHDRMAEEQSRKAQDAEA